MKLWSPLLHTQNGRLLLTTFAGSSINIGIIGFALPWLTLQLGGSVSLVAFIGAIEGAVEILLMLPAGIWADRRSRQHLLLLAATIQVLIALGLLALVLTGTLSILALALASTTLAAAGCVEIAAGYGALRLIVKDHELVAAQASLRVLSQIGYFGAPALGGLLFMLIGKDGLMIVLSASALLGLFAVSRMQDTFSVTGQEDISLRQQINDSIKVVLAKGRMRVLLIFGGAANVTIALSMSVFLVFLKSKGLSSGQAALVLAGGIIGSFAASPLTHLLNRRFELVRAAMLFGIGEAICIALVTQLYHPFALFACYALLMLCNTTMISILGGERARLAPIQAQAITATAGLAAMLSCWMLGALLCGLLTSLLSLDTVWMISAAGLLLTIIGMLLWAQIGDDQPASRSAR